MKKTKKANLKVNNPSKQQVSKLLEYYQKGRFDEAEKLSLEIIKYFPNHVMSWKVLGSVLGATGRKYEALDAKQTVVQLSPQDFEAYYNLGNTFKELGILEKAVISFSHAISLKPDYAQAHNNLGNTFQELGRLDEAVASFTEAIVLNPDYTQAHNNLGNTFQELGRLDEAVTSFTQAIVLRPDYAKAHYNLGNTLTELGRLEKAVASYNKAIALKPDFAEAHTNLANTLTELGRLDKALASYNQVIALKPDSADAYSNLGFIFRGLDRLEEAITSTKKAIALKPDSPEYYSNLGAMFHQLGRLDEAVANYNKAIALKPDYMRAKHMLAALTGEITKTAPRDYVERLFDYFANHFEKTLVDKLEYRIPKVVSEIIIKDSKSNFLGSITDLGCGTGLFGVEIKKFSKYLEGVDLSQKMLKKAEEKTVYDKLIKQDILDYLSNANLNFDYFVSTDVFIYIGDLDNVFRLIKSRNEKGGKLVFSTEDYNGEGFFLEQSGRYSHSKKYIDGLCKKFGFEISHFVLHPLRKEENKIIIGGIYLLTF